MRRLSSLLLMAMAVVLLPLASDGKRKRTSADAMRQRQQTERELADTNRKLTEAEAGLQRRMQNLNRLQQRIADTNAGIKRLQLRIDSIVGASKAVSDSIALRESELATLRGHYARTVRASRRYRREMNTINFLFSADDFSQAYRRMRYLEEYSGWRHRKTEQIQQVMADLGKQKERLAEMHSRLNALKASASREYRSLRQSRDSAQTVINSLKGETKRLNTLLRRQQNQLKSLDDELTRLIAREEAERKAAEEAARRKAEAERAAAEKARAEAAKKQAGKNQRGDNRQEAKPEKTTPKPAQDKQPKPVERPSAPQHGDFASQKGKLPSPLSHTFTVVSAFGPHRHPTLSKVQVDNPGIDVETAAGARARAVYPGVVSAVFMQNGYGHVVLLRHGDYLTVYANIETLGVKKGDSVKAGDTIGIVAPSESNPSRGLLHFEIRKEKTKFDPLSWLRK
ncbi:MAG: peptidoglycan DD-metalloendopeptidase family protein [Muribaculaceae bacterium]|nr:peptidoglycan DD-metalloendopeptidase family protein [Muribaculaceae bacterium]MDE5971871.1 peptidoglycan DD-metalloendopeptidase family protein [Muribaculaceae bacterium]MDE6461839.1 peptidoglycan DD-metalloendopeptidase family protein [Muribaculaceae bacterium]